MKVLSSTSDSTHCKADSGAMRTLTTACCRCPYEGLVELQQLRDTSQRQLRSVLPSHEPRTLTVACGYEVTVACGYEVTVACGLFSSSSHRVNVQLREAALEHEQWHVTAREREAYGGAACRGWAACGSLSPRSLSSRWLIAEASCATPCHSCVRCVKSLQQRESIMSAELWPLC